jgi:hypothetical protein
MVPRTSVRFYSVVRGATPPMPADQSALGTMPMGPYQYCEALRTASGYGWYAFPLEETLVRWDGHNVWVWNFNEGEWEELFDSIYLSDEATEQWRQHAPAGCEPPPVLTGLFVPGIIQLWTGLLVTTGPDWSLHVRPVANVTHSRAYEPYEGIIETDEFKPCPLFINIRLIEANRDVLFSKGRPLFQVQPLPRAAYRGEKQPTVITMKDMKRTEWEGIEHTIRPLGERLPGAYAAAVRRRVKKEESTSS